MTKPADAKAVFQDARDRPAAEQAAFLDAACGGDAALRARVEALLAADERAGPFLSSPTGGGADDPAPREQPGTVIGHFKLQQEIGEGGFGTVWMAEQQQPVRRQVALKVVKRGMDTRSVVARFEQERQALAMMDHPNIAKVFDGGETPAGRPYFAMELVRGVPITQYCDQQHLDAKERLALFVLVCHAVQHAHQKGIIHRDIKPTNVLVTLHDGVPVPKVIDFGIAKAVHRPLTEKTLFTEFRQMIGTPEYMSPEQAELSGLDIDTRADIYSLGVLLYELLTGTLPFDASTLAQKGLMEMLRTIREDEPQKPSTRVSTPGASSTEVAKRRRTDPRRLGKLLRGDLDWIVMKALEKDRGRRYVSADAFAADVQRHLRDEPVLASPPGQAYRLRKYVRRHRVGVTAGGLVVAALVVGFSAAVWGMLEAQDQTSIATAAKEAAVAASEKTAAALVRAEAGEEAAQKQAARSKRVLGFLDRALASANPEDTKGSDYKVRDLLDDFESSLGKQLEGDPEIEATVQQLLGRGFMGLGNYDKAEAHLTLALDLAERFLADHPTAVAESLRDCATLLQRRGRYADCLPLLDRAVARLQQPELPAAAALADVLLSRAHLQSNVGLFDRGEQDALAALAIAKSLSGDAAQYLTAASTTCLAQAMLDRGHVAESVQLFEAALAQVRDLPDNEAERLTFIGSSFASALREQGDLGRAEQVSREDLEQLRTRLGDDHKYVATARLRLSNVLLQRSKLSEAEQEVRTALATLHKRFGDEHPDIAVSNMTLANILSMQGKLDDAETIMRDSIAAQSRLMGFDKPSIATSLNSLALLLMKRGKLREAEERARKGVDATRAAYGDPSAQLARGLNTLALILLAANKVEEAEPFARQSLAMKRLVWGPVHPDVANGLNNFALVLCRLERFAEAEATHREALTMQEQVHGSKHDDVVKTMHSLGECLAWRGKFVEAEGYFRKALDVAEELHGPRHPLVADNLAGLGNMLEEQKKWDEAERCHRRSLDVALQLYGDVHADVADSTGGVARALNGQGKCEEAEQMARRALQLWRDLPEPNFFRTAQSLQSLASMLLGNGKTTEAVVAFRELVDHQREHTSAGSPAVGRALRELGKANILAKDFAAADAALRECEAMQAAVAPGSFMHCQVMGMRGYALSQLGRFEEADTLLRQCREKMQPLAKATAEQRRTLENLVRNCEAWNKPEAAAQWRKVLDTEFPPTGK